jgi:hypothetical protein
MTTLCGLGCRAAQGPKGVYMACLSNMLKCTEVVGKLRVEFVVRDFARL